MPIQKIKTSKKTTVKVRPPLLFSTENAKLPPGTATFSIPAGHTCPGAQDCLARRNLRTGRLIDGPEQKFRCYAASMEVAFPSLAGNLDYNMAALRKAGTESKMAALIRQTLPGPWYNVIRVHVHGDFFSAAYFRAWMRVAQQTPEKEFYAYTKSLHHWRDNMDIVPPNFVLTASRGGKFDHLIDEIGLRNAKVVFHPEEAELLGLEIDKTEVLARNPEVKEFTLLIHGQQPKQSWAGDAIKRLKKEKIKFSYGRKSKG